MNKTGIIAGVGIAVLVMLFTVHKYRSSKDLGSNNGSEISGSGQGDANHPGQSTQQKDASNREASGKDGKSAAQTAAATSPDGKAVEMKKENNCFVYTYHHLAKNQDRDIEEFLNDTNAFQIDNAGANQKSVCVKVNNKPVAHKFVKKNGKAEVIIGSVVGPDSTIQVSYCLGTAPCKESCIVKSNNKVDELLSDHEMGGLDNAELEGQVKELRHVASANGNLMDATIIRDWNKEQTKEWYCENK